MFELMALKNKKKKVFARLFCACFAIRTQRARDAAALRRRDRKVAEEEEEDEEEEEQRSGGVFSFSPSPPCSKGAPRTTATERGSSLAFDGRGPSKYSFDLFPLSALSLSLSLCSQETLTSHQSRQDQPAS